MDRLVFNTPTRWADGSQAVFIAFIVFFLGFLVLIFIGFLIFFLAYPDSRKQLISRIDYALTPQLSEQDLRENAFLFRDPEVAPVTDGAK